MDVVQSITNQRGTRKRKRKRNGSPVRKIKKSTTAHNKRIDPVSVLNTTLKSSELSLLDLPEELLIEIFLFSTNSALPETCLQLYNALCANPKHNSNNVGPPIWTAGPPMWLQLRFVRNTNPTLSFAVEKCLRRRFFGAETFRAFLPELISTSSLETLTVPLRCVTRCSSNTREFLLYTELFLNGVRLTRSSRNKALIYMCTHYSHADPNAHFWKATFDYDFSTSTILQAYTCAAKKKFYDPMLGTFEFLISRFGVEEDIGESLYDYAALHHDQQLISILQRHGVRPGMAALQKLMAVY